MAEFPCVSPAVQVTCVFPTLKKLPEGGRHVTEAAFPASLAATL
jgi:hypothetical protein